MSVALWPVCEDGQEHELVDEGVVLLEAAAELDALAEAAGRVPLTAFDAYVDVPEETQTARAAERIAALSDLPVSWHDPVEAVLTLNALIAGVRDEYMRDCL